MKRSKFTEEQIIAILREKEAGAMTAARIDTEEIDPILSITTKAA